MIGRRFERYDVRRMRAGVAALALVLAARAGERTLELWGRIEPPPRLVEVSLHGAYTPFVATTQAGPDGRFRFRRLAQGTYTISVFRQGVGEVRRTVEVTPQFADARGRVEILIHFEPGGAEEANVVSVRQLSIPNNALKEYERAQARLGERDVEGAVRCLERAVELAPQFSIAWNHLGTIAYQSGRYPDAEKYFRKALEQDPAAYSPLVNLGGVLLNLNRPKEAVEYNRRAVRERPDDALANSQLGTDYYFLGDLDQAEKYLRTAKRLDPSHFSNPQLLLAEIRRRRGDRAGAIRELEDFLARRPEAPKAGAVRRQIEKLKSAP